MVAGSPVLVAADTVDPVAELDIPAPVAEQVWVAVADPGCNYGGRSRLAVGYNGYT